MSTVQAANSVRLDLDNRVCVLELSISCRRIEEYT